MLVLPRSGSRRGRYLVATAAVLVAGATVAGQEQPPVPLPDEPRPAQPPPQPAVEAPAATPPAAAEQPVEPPKYAVSRFVIRYASENTDHPDPEDVLRSATVRLGIGPGGYIEAREGTAQVTLHVADIADEPMRRFNSLALTAVVQAVFAEYKRRGIVGVVVDANEDIHLPLRRDPVTGQLGLDTDDPDVGKDFRPERRPDARTEIHLVVYTGAVAQVRTQASGERINPDARINNPAHEFIRRRSPVQPGADGAAGRGSLLRKDLVDEFMYRLNRHPGRRVDAAVSAGEQPGELVLDYLVNEVKPWSVYGQISNTGTDETDEWRERVGFVHNQLSGHDDILTVDFVTAALDATNALLASYEAPIGDSETWRWRLYGNWNEYTAADVGFAAEDFSGDGWTAGGDLILNFYQERELFLDAVAGARWQYVTTDNDTLGTTGQSDFFIPSLSVRLERQTELATTLASIGLEGNVSGVAGTDEDELDDLGRLETDADWIALKFDASHSFFLEPFFYAGFDDPAKAPTLAHELQFSVRGQWAPGYRLVPNFEQVIGGFYSVRGYEESVAAGDTVVMGGVEYRWHIPWGFKNDPQAGTAFGRTFRWRPQQPYGRADWDLIARGFFDIGYAANSDKQSYEDDELLYGAGIGLEFVFKRNLSLRVDWGVALKDTKSGQDVNGTFEPEVEAGSSRIHFSGTILY